LARVRIFVFLSMSATLSTHRSLALLLADRLQTLLAPQPSGAASGDETNLLTRGSVAANRRSVANVLVVTATVRCQSQGEIQGRQLLDAAHRETQGEMARIAEQTHTRND